LSCDTDLYLEIAEDAKEFALQPDMGGMLDLDIYRLIQSDFGQGPPVQVKFWRALHARF